MLAKVTAPDLRVKIPSFLLTTPAWVGHRRLEGRSKVPVVLPEGKARAKSNLPSTWRPFDQALEFYRKTFDDHNSGIGFVLSAELGLVFIDFDHCLDAAGAVKPWAAPLLAPFRGQTYIERSLSGEGLHVLTFAKLARACRKQLSEDGGGVEVYTDRRYVAITGELFEAAPVCLSPMQTQVDDLLRILSLDDAPVPAPEPVPDSSEVTATERAERLEEAASALAVLDPDLPHDEWLRVGMALQHGLGEDGFALWDSWSAKGKKYQTGETRGRWVSFKARGGVTLSTLFYMAAGRGWKSPLDDPKRQFTVWEEPEADQEATLTPFDPGSYQEWLQLGLQLWQPNPKQEVLLPCFNEANLHAYFAHHAGWGEGLRFNVRTQYPERAGEVIDTAASYRALAQSHAFLGWAKRAYSVKTVQAVVQAVAETRPFDPVADFLSSLTWDGVRRMGTLCATLGLEATPLTERFLQRWLIGAVARALRPGCDMQNMILFTGQQGQYKSRFLRRLAVRPEWFHESHIELSNKEGYIVLERKWIVEFAELASLRKAESEKVKAFITDSTSSFRSPYARTAEDHPRRYVLAGTVNSDEMLSDPTGARRFWVIRCPGPIRHELLDDSFVRQLWAEATVAFHRGARWWDEDAEVREVNYHNEQYYGASSMELAIQKVVEEEFAHRGAVHLKHLVSRLLELHIVTPGTSENALGDALRHLGWERQVLKIDNRVYRFWYSPEVKTPEDRRKAAVVVLEDWKRSTGQFSTGGA